MDGALELLPRKSLTEALPYAKGMFLCLFCPGRDGAVCANEVIVLLIKLKREK